MFLMFSVVITSIAFLLNEPLGETHGDRSSICHQSHHTCDIGMSEGKGNPTETKGKETRIFAPSRQVIFSKVYHDNITIREFKGCNVANGAAVIEAFAHSEQLDIGQMAASYLIKQLDLNLIGDVVSE